MFYVESSLKISSIEAGEKQSDIIKEVDLENSRSIKVRTSHLPSLQTCPNLVLEDASPA